MTKIVSIQLLRALACLLVLQTHLLPVLPFINLRLSGAIGVHLFFIISGYIIAASIERLPAQKPLQSFFINRFSRVIPYYYLLTLVTLLLFILFNVPFTGIQVIKSFLFIPQVADPILVVGWSLNHEILFYLVAGMLAILVCKRNILFTAIIYSILIAAFSLLHTDNYILNFLGSNINYTFILGLLSYRFRNIIGRYFNHPLLLAASFMLFIGVAFCGKDVPYGQLPYEAYISSSASYHRDTVFRPDNTSIPSILLWGLPSLFLFICFLANEQRVERLTHSLPSKIGDASYSLYLIQGVFLYFFSESTLGSKKAVCLLLFVATVVAALCIYPVEKAVGSYTKKQLTR